MGFYDILGKIVFCGCRNRNSKSSIREISLISTMDEKECMHKYKCSNNHMSIEHSSEVKEIGEISLDEDSSGCFERNHPIARKVFSEYLQKIEKDNCRRAFHTENKSITIRNTEKAAARCHIDQNKLPVPESFLNGKKIEKKEYGYLIFSNEKPILVLDLDNTLIYPVYTDPSNVRYHKIEIKHYNRRRTVWILERPYLQRFLVNLSPYYNLIVFTAGIREYGVKAVELIDPEKHIQMVFDRQHCIAIGKNSKNQYYYTKDLRVLGCDLSRTVIVDDKEFSYIFNRKNGQNIPTYFGEDSDNALLDLEKYLREHHETHDFRERKPLVYGGNT